MGMMTTEPITYVCRLPVLPPSLNVWRHWHWAKQDRERKAFQTMLWAVLNEKGNKCPRGLEAVDLHAVLCFPTKRGRDSDNYGAVLWKWVQDTLTQEGVIPDDTADRCTAHAPQLLQGPETTMLLIVPRDESRVEGT